MNFTHYLAHAESFHNTETSGLIHTLTQAYVAIPLYIALHILVVMLAKKLDKKPAIIPIIMGINVFIGIFTYSLVPALSVFAISAGIVGALVISFLAIANS